MFRIFAQIILGGYVLLTGVNSGINMYKTRNGVEDSGVIDVPEDNNNQPV